MPGTAADTRHRVMSETETVPALRVLKAWQGNGH